ncbi:unnamed protein product [Discosporangium mesarthrocarpum]
MVAYVRHTPRGCPLHAIGCIAALRQGCVSCFLGQTYNDFLAEVKSEYGGGMHGNFWEEVVKEKGMVGPITVKEDSGLEGMDAAAAEALMQMHIKELADEGVAHEEEEDEDLDDMA